MSQPGWEMNEDTERLMWEFEQIKQDPAYQAWLKEMERQDERDDARTDNAGAETTVSGR